MRYLLLTVSLIVSLSYIITTLLLAAFWLYLGKLLKNTTMEQFGFNCALAVDQYGNALLLGDPDETISSRTGRAMKSGKPKRFVPYFAKLVDFLAWVFAKETNHVIDSIEYDENPTERELWSWIKD